MSDRAWLRRRIAYVRVHSCADGSMGINVAWKEPYARRSEEFETEMPPGLFTRMVAAERIERILNKALGAGASDMKPESR